MAARDYVSRLEDKREAAALLAADDFDVQEIGLQALRGQQVDRTLLDAVAPLFQANRLQVRRTAARVYEESPETGLALEMAGQIVESLGSVDRSPDAGQQIGYGPHAGWAPFESDVTQVILIRALAQIKGLNLTLLRSLQPNSPDIARDGVFIARAKRGDRDIRTELVRIAHEAPLPLVRCEAVGAFIVVGDIEDIPFLDEISRKDPFDVSWSAQDLANFRYLKIQPEERKYPVRIAAREAQEHILREQYHPLPK